MIKRRFFLLLVVALVAALADVSAAADLPYDTKADAGAQVRLALAQGADQHRPTLIIFGANWCSDCRVLWKVLQQPENQDLLAMCFQLVKVDVGEFDHNMALAMEFDNPTAGGIPAAVVVDAGGKQVYSTKAGELADARRMSPAGIHDFLVKLARLGGAPLPVPP